MIPSRSLFPTLALGLLAAPAVAQDGAVAVRAGKVITGPGQVIENGTVVVQNGRIVAVGGADLEVPFDVLLHEHPDAVLFAGFLEAHSSNVTDALAVATKPTWSLSVKLTSATCSRTSFSPLLSGRLATCVT